MRNLARSLVLGGAMLAAAAVANAQTVTLLDTIGATIPGSGVGSNVGYDPNSSVVPSQAISAGYVVLPFTLSGSGSFSNITIQTVFQGNAPVGQTTPLNDVYGAFITPTSSTNSLSGNTGNVVGGFFKFDTSAVKANPSTKQLITGTDNVTLNAGTQYWLVISPKNGFASQNGDTLFQVGLQISNVGTALNGGSNTIAGQYTVGQTLFENLGANSGDTLSPQSSGSPTNRKPDYGYFRLTTTSSSVPESSTVMTSLLGLTSIGGLLVRRRRAA